MCTVSFNENYGKWFINDTLRAIKNYSMIPADCKVYVALSGGKDSVTMLYILNYINRYSRFRIELSAVHVKTADYDTSLLKNYCEFLQVKYLELELSDKKPRLEKNCSICSRLKRGAICSLAKNDERITVAFGHHSDDAAETLLMNIVNNKKLGCFSPVVELPDASMRIIRPMIYLDESTISKVHNFLSLPLLTYDCPYAKDNVRKEYKLILQNLRSTLNVPDISKKFVAALENVDSTNVWKPNHK